MLNGYKTYIAAALLILGGLGLYISGGPLDRVAEMIFTGLGFAGLRNAKFK